MNHTEAVRDQLVERYFLGELEMEQRDAFEEHYFTCPLCAGEVRLAASFEANARAVLREQPHRGAVTREASGFSRFWSWLPLQPSWALSAVLLLMTGWQTLIRIPGLEQRLERAQSPQVVQVAVLRSETRGAGTVVALPKDALNVLLTFDVNTDLTGGVCKAALRSESGNVVFSRPVSCPAAGTSVHLLTPVASLQPGSYTLTVSGQAADNSRPDETLGPYRFNLQRL